MKKWHKILLVSMLLTICGVGGAFVWLKNLPAPTAKVEKVQIEILDENKANIELQLHLDKLMQLDYFGEATVVWKNKTLFQTKIRLEETNIQDQKAQVFIPVVLDLEQIRQMKAAHQSKSVVLQISGNLGSRFYGRDIEIPFSLEKELPVRNRKKPEVKIEKIEIQVGKENLQLSAVVKVKNTTQRELPPFLVKYNAKISSQTIVSGQVESDAVTAPGSWSQVRLPIQVQIAELKKMRSSGKEISVVTLEGQAVITRSDDKIEIPFLVKKTLPTLPKRDKQNPPQIKKLAIKVGADKTVHLNLLLHLQTRQPKLAGSKISYNISLADLPVASGDAFLQAIPKSTELRVLIPASIQAQNLKKIRAKSSSVALVKVQGQVHLKNQEPFPFVVTKELVLPQAQDPSRKRQVKILSYKMSSAAGMKKIDLMVEVSPALPLKEMLAKYEVQIADSKVAKGEAYIRPQSNQSKSILSVPIQIKDKLLQATKAENLGKTVPLKVMGTFDGEGKRGKVSIPFQVEKETVLKGKAIELRGIKVHVSKISLEEMQLELQARVFSKFAKEIKKLHVHYERVVDDIVVMKGDVEADALVPGKENLVTIPVTIAKKTWTELKKKYDGQTILMIYRGKIQVELADKKLDFPFEVEKEMFIRKRPFKIKVKKFRIKKLRLRERTYFVILELTSFIPKKIENFKIDGDIEIAKGIQARVLNENITLEPNGKSLLEVEISLKRFSVFRLIGKMIRQKFSKSKLSLKMKGKTSDGTVITSEETSEQEMEVEEVK